LFGKSVNEAELESPSAAKIQSQKVTRTNRLKKQETPTTDYVD